MTFDLNSLMFFAFWLLITTMYGTYMRRVGVRQGINDTLITISESKSEILREALNTLAQKAERHYGKK